MCNFWRRQIKSKITKGMCSFWRRQIKSKITKGMCNFWRRQIKSKITKRMCNFWFLYYFITIQINFLIILQNTRIIYIQYSLKSTNE